MTPRKIGCHRREQTREGGLGDVAKDCTCLRTIERDEAKVWNTLTTLAHPDVFARLVEDQRREQNSAKRMKNDDVTLMRLRMLAGQPAFLLACR